MKTIHNHLFTKVFALTRILSRTRAAFIALLAMLLGMLPHAQAATVPVGPQANVSKATVAGWGFTVVYQGSAVATVPISTIFTGIGPSDYVMYAAAPVGSSTYTVLAAARFSNVTTYTPHNTLNTVNGTGWYYNANSIGFAPVGSTISQNSADTNNFGDPLRLSWHTSFNGSQNPGIAPNQMFSGYRAGTNTTYDGWEKFVLVGRGPTTTPATAITPNEATLNATINPSGLATTAWFEWGTSPELIGATSTTAASIGNGSSDVAINHVLTELTPDTTYYFRGMMNNTAGGTQSGIILSFTTGPEIAVEHPAGTSLVDGTGSVAFPDTGTNQTVLKTFTIKNTGGLVLENLAITKSGTGMDDYSVSALSTTTLAAGASTTFTVTFAPSTTGARPAALLIASNDANENPFDIVLAGNGIPPSAIIGGSDLLTGPDVATLSGWLGEGAITLTKVFAAAPGDGKTASNFHTAVNGIGRTFTVIELPVQNGQTRRVIGGYNPQSWSSNNDYNYTYSDAQRTAFLFNLTTGVLQRQRLSDSQGQYQTYNNSNYGPTFGGGHDLYMDNSLRSGYANYYSYGATGQNTTGYGSGYNNFTIARMEVFTIAAGAIATAPVVTTNAASSVGTATATLNGLVNPSGAATNASFRYGTDSTLTVGTNTANQGIGSGSSAVVVTQAISGLSAHTTYYFRATGTNTAGTTNGSILNFTTGNSNPVAQSLIIAATTGDQQTSSGFFSSLDVDGDSVSITAVNAVAGLTVDSFDASSITYTPLSNFAGDASFTYTLSDGFGGTATGTFTVRVADNDAPTVAAHENVEVDAESPAGAVVTYADGSANDNVGVTGVMYSHASGSTFPVGTTTVIITATDAANNTGTGSFTVTVRKLPQTITFSGGDCGKEDVLSTVTLNGTASSGLTVSYSIMSGPGSVTGNELTFSGLGDVVVRASQAGDSNYEPASPVDVTFKAVVNTAPVAVDDKVTTTVANATLYPLANDTDAQGDLLEIVSVSDARVSIVGRSLIIPKEVSGTFTYTVSDCIATDIGTVTVAAGTVIDSASKWAGLLYDEDGVIAGRMQINRSSTGRCSVSVKVGALVATAIFSIVEGEATVPTAMGSFTLAENADGQLEINLSSTSNGTLTGTLRAGISSVIAQKYNVALAGSERAVIPGGGHMLARLRTSGMVTFVAKLPDGRTVSATSQYADNGSFDFYGFVASTSPRAVVAGEGNFEDLTSTDLTAELAWLKPSQTVTTGLHSSGVDTVLVANGCAFNPGDPLPNGAGTLTIAGGNLASDSSVANVITNGIPTFTSYAPVWTSYPLQGRFLVKIKDPARTRAVNASGVYLPKSNSAWGWFPGTTQGGRIELSVP